MLEVPPQESYAEVERWRRSLLIAFAVEMLLIALITLAITPMPGAKHGLSKLFAIAIAIPAAGLPGGYAIWALAEHVSRPTRDVIVGTLMLLYVIGAALILPVVAAG